MNRRRLLVLVVALTALPSACGGDDDASTTTTRSTQPTEVTIRTFNFQPDPLRVDAGERIEFTNDDKIDHTVTAGTRQKPMPETFDGLLPRQGTTYELRLDEPGTYRYFCQIHTGPGMTGTILVSSPESATSPG